MWYQNRLSGMTEMNNNMNVPIFLKLYSVLVLDNGSLGFALNVSYTFFFKLQITF